MNLFKLEKRKEVFAWSLYDFANQPFTTIIISFIYSAFFIKVISPNEIMGTTMWLQQKLNPAPPDPIQKTLFTWMPILMVFIAANFPVGLVIYWAWNGILSIMQQMYIMKKQGTEIALFAKSEKE